MELTKLSDIRPLLERHGFTFSKSLGQNFLVNASVPVKIAESANLTKDTLCVEIGPGIGCLTRELALRAGKVVAVELDKRLVPILHETLAEFDNVTVLNEDALKVDFAHLCRGAKDVAVCANLPYYITTPILMHLLENRVPARSVTVMVQKEVARRLCAKAGTPAYGAITASVQYYTEPKVLFDVSSGSFYPAPKVDSSVIELRPVPPRLDPDTEKVFKKLVSVGFGQRRKMFANVAAREFSLSKEEFAHLLQQNGYAPDARAETVDVEGFMRLARAVKDIQKGETV